MIFTVNQLTFVTSSLQNSALGGATSDGSTDSHVSAALATSPVGGLSGYSPFMGMPWGNDVNTYLSDPPVAPHLEIPESPLSPGVAQRPSSAAAQDKRQILSMLFTHVGCCWGTV